MFCRFLGLSRLGGSYFTLNNIVGLVAIIWITVCAINLPLFISTDAAIIMTPFQKVCLFSRHTNPRDAGIYELFSRVLVFVLPLAIIWGSHIGIYCKMRRGKKKVITFIYLVLPKSVKLQHVSIAIACSASRTCFEHCQYVKS